MNRENYFILWFLLHVSLPVWSGNYNPYEEAIANSECDVFFMDSPWPFNVTKTQSNSISLFIPLPTRPSQVIPEAVTVTAKTAGAVASVTSIAAISPMLVTQANRIGTVTNILSCNDNSQFDPNPLDWTLSPLQLSIGEGLLQYVDGAVVGNWVLFSGLAVVYTALAKKFGETAVRYPGYLVLPGLFLSSATAQNAVTLIRLGNSVEKSFGSVSLAAQLGVMGFITRILWPSRFQAEVKRESARSALYYLGQVGVVGQFLASKFSSAAQQTSKQKWRAKQEDQAAFVKQYGPFFRDYRQDWYGFMVPELLMTLASGTLNSFQINPQSSCSALLYTTTGVYGVYATTLIALRPHRLRFDRIYFGSVAGMQFSALIIGIAQQNIPSLQNSTKLQAVAEGIPIALQYVTLARSVYDLGIQVTSGYKFFSDQRLKKAAASQGGTTQLALGFDDQEMVGLDPKSSLTDPLMGQGDEVETVSSVSLGEQLDETMAMLNEEDENFVQQDGVSRRRAFTFNTAESVGQMRNRLEDLFNLEEAEQPESKPDESIL